MQAMSDPSPRGRSGGHALRRSGLPQRSGLPPLSGLLALGLLVLVLSAGG